MKLQFLGTAAAEGWPALFCNCPNCRRARELGGREIRTRSQSLLDNHILIDFPADTYAHKLQWNLDLSACDLLLITHAHSDHLYPMDLEMRGAPYGHEPTVPVLNVVGGKTVMETIEYHAKKPLAEIAKRGYTFTTLEFFKPVELCGTRILPMPASHFPNSDAMIYSISTGGKNILYLHDTGELYDECYDALQKDGRVFDFVTYDCCYCNREGGYYGHMGLPNIIRVRERLAQIGVIDDHTTHCVNHFSHNTAVSHDEMAQAAWNEGMLCSYDGMIVEF